MTHHPLPPPRTPPPAAVRAVLRLGRVLTGLAAAGLLAALLAGVPYGLWHWLGWPLPHHVPTWQQTRDTLTGPFTDRLLLNTLACLCWILWAVFLTDIARAIPDTLRDAHHNTSRATAPATFAPADRRSGPLRGLATLLLGAIVAGLLSLRPHPALTARSAAPLRDERPSITTAAVHRDPLPGSPTDAASVAAGAQAAVVQPPHDGIHDSLWRIADRCLGSGARWPEIYQLNKGAPQPDGGALTVPSLIRPGWVLKLPQTVTQQPPASPAGGPTPPRTSPRVPTSPPAPGGTTRPAPAPTTPSAPSMPSRSPQPSTSPAPGDLSGDRSRHSGVDLGDGVYVSLALAAAISSSLVIARRRRRRWYTPGSGRRDDLPVAPVVASLHLAHLRATAPPGDEADSSTLEVEGEAASDTSDHDAGDPHPPSAGTHGAAGSASTDSLIDLAGQGVGLVGGGADNVARAALLDLLSATGDRTADVLVPAAELATLLGQHPNGPMPRRLHVVDTLDTALDQLEAATLHRVRQSGGDRRPIVLIARPGADTARLQAVLDNGATHNIRAVLLGQWRPGTSVYVGGNGVISASHGTAAALNGARLFTLPASQAVTLLNVLSEGEQNAQMPPSGNANLRASRTGVGPGAAIDPVTHPVSSESKPVAPFPDPHDGHAPTAADFQADPPPLDLRILGPLSLMWTTAPEPHSGASAKVEIIGALSPRLRELLVLLGLYPDGISRDRIADTLWPDAPPERPHNNLTTSLSRLRTGLGKATRGQVREVVLAVGDQLRLDPAVVRVDYRDFTDADTARRDAATDAARADAWRHMITTYRGELADGLSAEWLETPREAIRRDAIDAASRLARAVVATNPQQTLDLLETARARDPYNEQLYRDIMRVQRRLGQVDAIERTLALLATRLGELDEAPSRETVELASTLRRPVAREPGGTATPVVR